MAFNIYPIKTPSEWVSHLSLDPTIYLQKVKDALHILAYAKSRYPYWVEGASIVYRVPGVIDGLEAYRFTQEYGERLTVFRGHGVGASDFGKAYLEKIGIECKTVEVYLTVKPEFCTISFTLAGIDLTCEIPIEHFYWLPYTVILSQVEGVMEVPPKTFFCYAEDSMKAEMMAKQEMPPGHSILWVSQTDSSEAAIEEYWGYTKQEKVEESCELYHVIFSPVNQEGRSMLWPPVHCSFDTTDAEQAKSLAEGQVNGWLPPKGGYKLNVYKAKTIEQALSKHLEDNIDLHVFNTGRTYTERGQRIAWAPVSIDSLFEWKVLMVDVDRSCSYVFTIAHRMLTDNVVLNCYDNNLGQEITADLWPLTKILAEKAKAL